MSSKEKTTQSLKFGFRLPEESRKKSKSKSRTLDRASQEEASASSTTNRTVAYTESVTHVDDREDTASEYSQTSYIYRSGLSRAENLVVRGEKLVGQIVSVTMDLDNIEAHIKEVDSKASKLKAAEVKRLILVIETNLKKCDKNIHTLYKNVHQLHTDGYQGWERLQERIEELQRRSTILSTFEIKSSTAKDSTLMKTQGEGMSISKTREERKEECVIIRDEIYIFLSDCLTWVQQLMSTMSKMSFGSDVSSIKDLYRNVSMELENIRQYKANLDQCQRDRSKYSGEELRKYNKLLHQLETEYQKLLDSTLHRLHLLEVLLEFSQDATRKLSWLDTLGDVESQWENTHPTIKEMEDHILNLTGDIERHRDEFQHVILRGESMINQDHPGSECIKKYLTAMKSQWAWLIDFKASVEKHLSTTRGNQDRTIFEKRNLSMKEKKHPGTLHSRTELMREVRKQKEQHRKEIRMLELELSRLKHRDPVETCELSEEDINFSDEDIIGEGAYSQVFHGNFNGSEVAIKRLKHSFSSNDKNYFAEEVKLLHGLRHPQIVLLIGVCTTGKLPIMVLEYMASGSLHQHLHDRSMPGLDHVSYYQISKDIALGMTYLHRHKPPVLHLDLKSLNILLNACGRAKIADFGFSKLKHDGEKLSGGLRGTPAWMAPELLDPTFGDLSIKADVYSFGVILWEMLTRETPYKGVGVFQILECIRNSKRPEIPEYCPDPLKGLINRCWKQKPNQRPSFKEILISLEGLQIPLEWSSLLSSAGIPHEVMEDPNSARSIINLINQSVDIPEKQLNELSLQSHDELIKPLVNLSRFIEEQTKRTSEPRAVHSPQGVSKSVKCSQNSKKPFAVPAAELAGQKLMLKSTTQGPHPSQLKNLNNITEQKFTSIAEVLKQCVTNRRFAMKMQNDSVDQSTLDSNWSVPST